jgi:sporulation protein YunB
MNRFLKLFIRSFLIIITILFLLLLIFRIKYHNDIVGLAKTQVSNSTSDLINDAVNVQIEVGNIQYERTVYFEKDLEGRITALKTNMSEINRLKTSILNLINDEILAMDTSDLGIPLGSLILPEVLSGRGPEIPIKIISIRNSDAYFESSFSQAGINQTLHKLSMNVLVDVSVLVLGKTENFTVKSQVVVAETVIVGNVPNTYLDTGGLYGTISKNSGINKDFNGSQS